MTLRIALLLIGLFAGPWNADFAAAGDLEPPAGKINAETWRKARDHGMRDLLVRFDDAAIASEVNADLDRRRLRIADRPAIERQRQRYLQLKAAALAPLARGDIEVRREYDNLPLSFIRVRDSAALLRLLRRHEVAEVYENKMVGLLSASLDLIGQPQAAQLLGQIGTGSTVAVLDTGVNYAGSAFGNCTAPGVPAGTCKVVAAVDTAPEDGALDGLGHGTVVAQTALSAAPGARIAAIDVYDQPLGGASTDAIIAGINWAIAHKSIHSIVAINISLGGGSGYADPCSGGNPLILPVLRARQAGILTVAASGNNSYVDGINYPACTPGVVSVGAVYDGNVNGCLPGLKDSVTCFSNVSDYLSLLTPASATSYAAPLASGAVAVLAAAYPGETPASWASRLTTSGKPVDDNRTGTPSGLGHVIPRLDMFAALRYPATTPPENDAFAAATQLLGDSGASLGWNAFASSESGEPAHAGIGNGQSVWWRWTASVGGSVSLDSYGSNFDTLMAVYIGNKVNALSTIAGNDDDGGAGGVSSLSFDAQAGTTYYFAIDGKAGASGNLYLTRSFVADIANLVITLGDTPDSVAAGATLAYTLRVYNSGPATAVNVTVNQTLPVGVSFVSADAGCSHTSGSVVCALGNLAAGEGASRDVRVTPFVTGTLTSQARVASSTSDGNALDNIASANTLISEANGSDGDVPIPDWALLLLACGLFAAMRGRG